MLPLYAIRTLNWTVQTSTLVAGFLGAFVFLVPVVLIHDLRIAAIGLSLAFFFAELIVAPIWSIPMDIAPRYAGSASGMMNFGFAVAGLVSPSSFGYLVDRTGSWVVPFIGSIAAVAGGSGTGIALAAGQTVCIRRRAAVEKSALILRVEHLARGFGAAHGKRVVR